MERRIREVAAVPGRRRFEGAGGWVELSDAGIEGGVRIQVDADDSGIWTALHDHGVQQARLHGARQTVSVVREDDPAADRLRHAGYTLSSRSWGALLELPDEPDWSQYEDLERDGLEIRELGPDDVEAAYEMYVRAVGDFPWTPATLHDRPDRESFAEMVGRDRVFGAFAEGQCLGLTVSRVDGATVDTHFTATDPGWRGRGVAAATKAAMIRVLHAEGGRHFRTGGAEVNLPMLSVNTRLGYRLEPWWLTFTREV
jgi:GNAT superfamily N-acetyltransferase